MPKKPARVRVCLVCWNAELADVRARELKACGMNVEVMDRKVSGLITYFVEHAPDAIVIDLDRLPSSGRDVGLRLRASKSTRHFPIVYLGGPADKIARLRRELPEAVYAAWNEISTAIRRATASRTANMANPRQPGTILNGCDTDLARRFGIKPATCVMTWGETDFLMDLMGNLPETVTVARHPATAAVTVWLCVVQTPMELSRAFDAVTRSTRQDASVWIVHPKQGSRCRDDCHPPCFNQNDVRACGLALGWIDSKVCSVDAEWSGLRFTRCRTDPSLIPRMMKPHPQR